MAFYHLTVLCVFSCCTYRQVAPRKPVPLSSRLKAVSGSKMRVPMKARPCVCARASASSFGSRVRNPLHSVARSVRHLTSLQRTSARLKLLERRTAARFLHTSPPSVGRSVQQHQPQPRHSGSLYQSSEETDHTSSRQIRYPEAMLRTTYLSRSDRQKEFHSKYIRMPVNVQSSVRHSARLANSSQSHLASMEEDTARTFIRRRMSPRKLDGDSQNFRPAGRQETVPWHSAVLQRSDDGNLGRFILRRSPLKSVSEAGRPNQSWRSADIYGPRYSRPVAGQSASVPTSSVLSSGYRCALLTAEKPDGDEHLLHAALLPNTVGFHWLAPVS